MPLRGYWTMAWLGLVSNLIAIPVIGFFAFAGPPLQVANISLAFSLAWPAAIIGIIASLGLLAERQWAVILSIVALALSLSASLPYGIVRLILVNDPHSLSGLSLALAFINLFALVYWCMPQHRRLGKL